MQDENKTVEGMVEGAARGATKGALEAVPLYQDALQPAAKELGKSLETAAKFVNVALAPIKGLVWSYERVEQYLGEKLGSKLKDVPEDQIVTPTPSIAVPAIQNLMLTAGEPTLSELYANLLATAMVDSTTSNAHPAFVDTIRQMSSDEAKLFKFFTPLNQSPCIRVRAADTDNETNFRVELPVFSTLAFDAKCTEPYLVGVYLDNLRRLGLIDITFGEHFAETNVYTPLKEHEALNEIKIEIEKSNKPKVGFDMGTIAVTQYGVLFYNSCVADRPKSRETVKGDS